MPILSAEKIDGWMATRRILHWKTLAERMEKHGTTLYRTKAKIDQGENVSATEADGLATALGVQVSDIMANPELLSNGKAGIE